MEQSSKVEQFVSVKLNILDSTLDIHIPFKGVLGECERVQVSRLQDLVVYY